MYRRIKKLLDLCNLREKKYPQASVIFVESAGNFKEKIRASVTMNFLTTKDAKDSYT